MTCANIADIVVILAWSCAALIAALILGGVFSYSALLRRHRSDPMLAILDDIPRGGIGLPQQFSAARRRQGPAGTATFPRGDGLEFCGGGHG